jgi:hypothetical protein
MIYSRLPICQRWISHAPILITYFCAYGQFDDLRCEECQKTAARVVLKPRAREGKRCTSFSPNHSDSSAWVVVQQLQGLSAKLFAPLPSASYGWYTTSRIWEPIPAHLHAEELNTTTKVTTLIQAYYLEQGFLVSDRWLRTWRMLVATCYTNGPSHDTLTRLKHFQLPGEASAWEWDGWIQNVELAEENYGETSALEA